MQTEVNKSEFTQRFTEVASTKRKTTYAELSVMIGGLPSTDLGNLIVQNKPIGRSHSSHPRLLAMVGFPAPIL
jgi:hypothetical protein